MMLTMGSSRGASFGERGLPSGRGRGWGSTGRGSPGTDGIGGTGRGGFGGRWRRVSFGSRSRSGVLPGKVGCWLGPGIQRGHGVLGRSMSSGRVSESSSATAHSGYFRRFFPRPNFFRHAGLPNFGSLRLPPERREGAAAVVLRRRRLVEAPELGRATAGCPS